MTSFRQQEMPKRTIVAASGFEQADIESMANAVGGGRDTSQACTNDGNL
jgi:hypothetical protein